MPDNSQQPNDDFIIPQKFLNQLQEFCNGGFILLTFSAKGNPVVHQYYETKKDQLALESQLFSFADEVDHKKFTEGHEETEQSDDDSEQD
jgi:hypothetical protein